jgi:hypothetical protein
MAEVNFSILTDLIDSLVAVMPSLVDLIVAVVPVVIIGSMVGALVVFIKNVLTKIQPAIEGTVIHRESRPNNFRRSFELDPSINPGKISARIEQGVVTLTLPKAEQVKPRKIQVN